MPRTVYPSAFLCPKPGQARLEHYRDRYSTNVAETMARAQQALPLAPRVRRLPTLVVDNVIPVATTQGRRA